MIYEKGMPDFNFEKRDLVFRREIPVGLEKRTLSY
jgi:hypothetical protein